MPVPFCNQFKYSTVTIKRIQLKVFENIYIIIVKEINYALRFAEYRLSTSSALNLNHILFSESHFKLPGSFYDKLKCIRNLQR